MSKKELFIRIFDWFCVFLFLATGITVIVLKHSATEYDHIILGSVLLVVGSAKIITYFLSSSFKDPRETSVVVGAAMTALGFIFLFSTYDIASLCFGWGILEIVASGIEIHQKSQRVKKEPIVIIEIAIAVGSLIFAILLCVRTTEALNAHLIFLGVSLILISIYQAFIQIVEIS